MIQLGLNNHFTFTYQHNPAAEDVDLSFQKSTDLTTWTDDPSVVSMGSVRQPDGTEQITYRLAAPITGGQRCFVRIVVELLP